jgi:hypothetical protein
MCIRSCCHSAMKYNDTQTYWSETITLNANHINCWHCRMSDDRQQHLRSRLKHVSMNNWNYTEYIPVVHHDLANNSTITYAYFFFWPLCCLFFFDVRILITPFVSSNSSYSKLHEMKSSVGKTHCSYGQIRKKTGVTSGAGVAYPARTLGFTLNF